MTQKNKLQLKAIRYKKRLHRIEKTRQALRTKKANAKRNLATIERRIQKLSEAEERLWPLMEKAVEFFHVPTLMNKQKKKPGRQQILALFIPRAFFCKYAMDRQHIGGAAISDFLGMSGNYANDSRWEIQRRFKTDKDLYRKWLKFKAHMESNKLTTHK